MILIIFKHNLLRPISVTIETSSDVQLETKHLKHYTQIKSVVVNAFTPHNTSHKHFEHDHIRGAVCSYMSSVSEMLTHITLCTNSLQVLFMDRRWGWRPGNIMSIIKCLN